MQRKRTHEHHRNRGMRTINFQRVRVDSEDDSQEARQMTDMGKWEAMEEMRKLIIDLEKKRWETLDQVQKQFEALNRRLLLLERSREIPIPGIPEEWPHIRRDRPESGGGRSGDESGDDNTESDGEEQYPPEAYMVSICC